jgi:hypothetical protein
MPRSDQRLWWSPDTSSHCGEDLRDHRQITGRVTPPRQPPPFSPRWLLSARHCACRWATTPSRIRAHLAAIGDGVAGWEAVSRTTSVDPS